MQRRTFLKNAGILSLGLSALNFTAIKKWYSGGHGPLTVKDLAAISNRLEDEFQQLLAWLRANGWTGYLHQTLGVNLGLSGDDLKKELIKELDNSKLLALRETTGSGYDDFSGERLVQPGFPAHSLIYHTMASPRVRPGGVQEYPTLQQIDLLENYIYALCDWEQMKSIYNIQSDKDLVFAVFAYEYRPAFKTPHHAYADMVYSRTGIARIGNEPLHYDKINRCHTAKPADAVKEKNVSVIPARYGLYIARRVKMNSIALVKSKVRKNGDEKDDKYDATKFFLQPIRKIFNNDALVNNAGIKFIEAHKSEKLQKLVKETKIKMWEDRKPTPRNSDQLIVQDEQMRNAGSSFLVISQYADLIRPAKENGHVLFFKVPKRETKKYDTRFFTALATQEVEDVELLLQENKLNRSYNKYGAPRNKPMFVNITNKKNGGDETFSALIKTKDAKFEQEMKTGGYHAPLFEDSICDGKVSVDTNAIKLEGIAAQCLPAFSVVTAPDFFPQVDPLDLLAYDIAPGLSNESNFYEGGVASLSTARIKPNPKMIDTRTEATKDTYLAVLSNSIKQRTGIPAERLPVYQNPVSERGYEISGFLPDVASSVFAPGWDVTYCSLGDKDIYVGTEGLGSPFVEDMKFCAALNGMWPATSPDAARTYQGSNEPEYRNPTAIPLLDHEIGICADGPAGKAHESWGWDGEQGPYLEKKKANSWMINFTDLGRADAVNNALNGRLDMSQLRKLKSKELIARMECLKTCIHTLKNRNFRGEYKALTTGYTYLWLVSAEKVNWGNEDATALNIPGDLVGNDKSWITGKANAKVNGEGYLYVFVNSDPDNEFKRDWAPGLKRRRLNCQDIYVCQVTNNPASPHKIAWGKVLNGKISWQVK